MSTNAFLYLLFEFLLLLLIIFLGGFKVWLRLSQWFSGKESACNKGYVKKMWVQPLGWEDTLE